jgi:peroxiredoxin Q/BCP
MLNAEMDEVVLAEGTQAPDFELPDQNGKNVRLSDFRGKKVVLYFYPKDDTPGCTKEACSFRDGIKAIQDRNAIVLGVSNDSVDSHVKFAKKYSLNFPILSDMTRSVAKLYGVYKKRNLYGKSFVGIERTTFIIDEGGTIRKVFRKVHVDGHLSEVVNSL